MIYRSVSLFLFCFPTGRESLALGPPSNGRREETASYPLLRQYPGTGGERPRLQSVPGMSAVCPRVALTPKSIGGE